jgi:hypothetical protein
MKIIPFQFLKFVINVYFKVLRFINNDYYNNGVRDGAVVEATNRKIAGSIPDGVIEFFIAKIGGSIPLC